MRILIKGSLGVNGIAQVTMNYCLQLKSQNVYEFVLCEKREDVRKDFLEICNRNNWEVHFLPSQMKHPFLYRKELLLLLNKQFDVFHINGNSALMCVDVLIAKKKKIKTIAHCHSTNTRFPILHFLLKPILKMQKILRVACSDESANWAFGGKKVLILNNAINYSRFYYSEKKRREKREECGFAKDDVILLQVGNYEYEKNHLFTIDLLKKLSCNQKYKLVLCGGGEEQGTIQDYVKAKNLDDVVLFHEKTNRIEELYCMADVLLQPSIFEGLPLTVLEAQVCGLPCLLSNNITRNCIISNCIYYIDLKDVDLWETWIKKITDNQSQRSYENLSIDERFNISNCSEKLQSLYEGGL